MPGATVFGTRAGAPALMLGLILGIAGAFAQDPGFVLQGEGGLVTALLVDPTSGSTVYAATARGFFRSTDSGASWEPRNRGLEGRSVLSLAIDPASRGTLYAATDGGVVYRSTDGGGAWAPC